MYRSLFLVFIALFFVACAEKNKIVRFDPVKIDSKKVALNSRLNKALNDEYFGKFQEARDEYLALFRENKQEIFLEKSFALTLVYNLDQKQDLANLAQDFMNSNLKLKKLLVLYYLQINDLKLAKNLLQELLQSQKDAKNYELLGDIFLQEKNFSQALKFYKEAYEQDVSENLALKITSIYIGIKQYKAAKSTLLDFTNQKGCTLKTCVLLAQIYNDNKEFKELEKIYLELYKISDNEAFLYAILENFDKQNEFKKALQFALEYDLKADLILYFYQKLKQYEQAFNFALQKYKQTNEKSYLLQAAVMEFEDAMAKNKITRKTITSVASKFEKAVDENTPALYLNYYGYLLIDHNLDIQKGVSLVLKALELEPENLYYLDSLSWGYFKQNQCDKAWEVMLKTLHDKEFSNSDESQEHIKAIQKCLKGQK